MNRRIILKTVLICLGIFLIVSTTTVYILSNWYELDTEKRYRVMVAAANINSGDIITSDMIAYRTIKESSFNPHMIQSPQDVVGMKAVSPIAQGDYIPKYNILPKEQWYKDDVRIIILPMDIEGRLANLIRKGSLIDIKVEIKDVKTPPVTVLSKVFVEDILDENGINLGDNIGSKKAYAKVVLNEAQRDCIYVASQYGRLIYELYCDVTQKALAEEFMIPFENTAVVPSNNQPQSTLQIQPPKKEVSP